MEEYKTTKDFDLSLGGALKVGSRAFWKSLRQKPRPLLIFTALIAWVLAATLTGNVGEVRMDAVSYFPYHYIDMGIFIKYAAGLLIAVLLFVVWRGLVFMLMGSEVGAAKHTFAEERYAALRFLQFCLLSLVTFGIIAAALIFCGVRVSAWFFAALGVYVLVMIVPFYIAQYEYMLRDACFFGSVRTGFREMRKRGGGVWLRLVSLGAVTVVLLGLFLLPAAALMMGVYDNATAVMMEGQPATPVALYVLEFVFWTLGLIISLAVLMWAAYMMREIIFPPLRAATKESSNTNKYAPQAYILGNNN